MAIKLQQTLIPNQSTDNATIDTKKLKLHGIDQMKILNINVKQTNVRMLEL